MTKAYKGIIFDMDGLLFDTEMVYCEAHTRLAPKFGLSGYDEAYYLSYVGCSDKELHEALYRDFSHAGKEQVSAFIEASYTEVEALFLAGKVPLKPGAKELLTYFKGKNIPCVIASSNLRRFIDILVKTANIDSFFVDIVSSEDVQRAKPDPEIVLKAASVLGVAHSECLMFEDSANGIKAAFDAGVDVVMIPDLIPPTAALEAMAVTVLASLHDVPDYLEK